MSMKHLDIRGEDTISKCPCTFAKLFVNLLAMEQCTFKNVNNCLNKNIYSQFEASGGQSYNLYLNGVHFFDTSANQTSVAA